MSDSLESRLRELITSTLVETIQSEHRERLRELQQIRPNLKRTFLLNSCLAYYDGDDKHAVFSCGLGDAVGEELFWEAEQLSEGKIHSVDCMIDLERQKPGYLKRVIGSLKIARTERDNGLQVPYSDDEINEIVDLFVSDHDQFERYFQLTFELAEKVLSPVSDMIPQNHWIIVPI